MENIDRLVNELRKLSNETQWLEFKRNNYDPVIMRQEISALADSKSIHERRCTYRLIWI